MALASPTGGSKHARAATLSDILQKKKQFVYVVYLTAQKQTVGITSSSFD